MSELRETTGMETEDAPLSDLQQVLQRTDLGFVPLAKDDRTLLDVLPTLGSLTCFHGGRNVQIARTHAIEQVIHSEGGSTLLDAAAGFVWIGTSYRHALAALRRGEHAERPSLMLFNDRGERMLQVILEDDARFDAFRGILQEHKGCINCLRHAPASSRPPMPPFVGSSGALRDAWCEATSRADLQARLRGLGIDPFTAVRALEGLHTTSLEPSQFTGLLRRLVDLSVPVHLEVEQADAVVALEAEWRGLQRDGTVWQLDGPDCTLWIAPDASTTFWWVRQGSAHRLELFDAFGQILLTLLLRPEETGTRQLLIEWESNAWGQGGSIPANP